MVNFTIKVVSDTVCPFCFVGKRRLEKAIDVYKKTVPGGADDTFTVTWHPFYLDPTLPKTPTPSLEHVIRKFGADRVPMLHARLAATGKGEGINFTFSGMLGNTRDSHRLLQLAKTKGSERQNQVVEAIFKSYFEQGGDITSFDMLTKAAEAGGLDPKEAREWLETGKGGAEVDVEVENAYRKGVSGVPHFYINDKYEIGGAQEVPAFLEQFSRAKKSASGAAAATDSSLRC
ncbi:hypothetical protein MCOR25_005286 [Pyricularia grisea]|uniref:DSBA-like thioredoxin domain-containing protein n=1 Tax=Pyricularia grisea TaxID=148305 RepID=A0A6P8AWW7_PYRGI|nr:uncharacterized protein PgNI_08384 [Pyricularia grisea]KAI6365678.1 hypothetical protein MCOR25_005286 [Pyricularia grisea]TLD06654.1 hypothetical protein PgNI_08384 [Pyricularia grisea]